MRIVSTGADGDDGDDVEAIPTALDLPELARAPPCELDDDEVRLWSSQT